MCERFVTDPVNALSTPEASGYFPAIVCVVCDSPIDALVALCVRRDEATALVSASWRDSTGGNVIATLHGGRRVTIHATPDGRWAGCNAFMDELFVTPQEACRKLNQLLKRGRKGYVGWIAPSAESPSHESPSIQA